MDTAIGYAQYAAFTSEDLSKRPFLEVCFDRGVLLQLGAMVGDKATLIFDVRMLSVTQ